MSDTSKYDSRDFSAYDTMETEDLRRILRTDIESENQEQNTEQLFYIMNLLAEREEKCAVSRKTPEEAYAEFREFYDYSDEDVADAENVDKGAEPKPKKKALRLPCITKTLSRVAVIAIAVLVLSATLVMSVDAFRMPVINCYNTVFPDHSMLSFTQDASKFYPHNDILTAIQDAPVPPLYELDGQIIEDDLIMLSYFGTESAYMYLSISSKNAVINYDTEDMTATEMTIEGHDAILYKKDNTLQIVWLNEECEVVYLLTTNCLSEDRFWDVARYWAIQNIKLSER